MMKIRYYRAWTCAMDCLSNDLRWLDFDYPAFAHDYLEAVQDANDNHGWHSYTEEWFDCFYQNMIVGS